MREEIFTAWWKFTRWWIPVALFLILITPTDYGGAGIGLALGKGDTAFLTSLLFVLISAGIIGYKLFAREK